MQSPIKECPNCNHETVEGKTNFKAVSEEKGISLELNDLSCFKCPVCGNKFVSDETAAIITERLETLLS